MTLIEKSKPKSSNRNRIECVCVYSVLYYTVRACVRDRVCVGFVYTNQCATGYLVQVPANPANIFRPGPVPAKSCNFGDFYFFRKKVENAKYSY